MKKLIFALAFLFIASMVSAQISDSALRHLPLQGAINFRDLGGYPTKDGRHVKWKKIYRSAALDKLTEEDLSLLGNLAIRYDNDFRGPFEIAVAPDRMIPGSELVSLPAGSEHAGDPAQEKKIRSVHAMDSSMIAFYCNIGCFRARYKPVFDELLNLPSDSALLFHCAAGKDRTGIFAALLLHVLGVEDAVIWEDYLASNYYRRADIERSAAYISKKYGVDPEEVKGLVGVKKEFLEATFATINAQYGSLDAFLRDVMELDSVKIEKLKAMYLEN